MEYYMVGTAIELKPGIDTASSQQLSAELTLNLGTIMKTTTKDMLPKIEGGGWEIQSHAVTRLGNNLFVSFLVRR